MKSIAPSELPAVANINELAPTYTLPFTGLLPPESDPDPTPRRPKNKRRAVHAEIEDEPLAENIYRPHPRWYPELELEIAEAARPRLVKTESTTVSTVLKQASRII